MFNSLEFANVSHYGLGQEGQASRFKESAIYERTLRAGKWRAFLGQLTCRHNALRDLAHVQGAARQAPRSSGVVNVQLSRIVGSEGRVHDFDGAFRPLSDNTRDRWISIAAATRNRVCLPPVELIQVGDEYFVRDGHHRISVARAMGQVEIESRIIYKLARSPEGNILEWRE
jgi:hypothetical protein